MGEYRYTLTVDGRRYRITSEKRLSDAELAELARRLRSGGGGVSVRVVEPVRTKRAEDLALLLVDHPSSRGRSGSELLEVVRRYAPPGMSEAELRWAALEIERRRGSSSSGRTLWNAFVRPETLAPQYDEGERPLRGVSGFIEGAGNLLGTPLRALATSVLTRFAQGGSFGKETGQASKVGGYAETYAADPNWGSVLEALAPGAPVGLRQAVGVGLNIFADPLNLVSGLGVVGRGASGSRFMRGAVSGAKRLERAAGRVKESAGKAKVVSEAGGKAQGVSRSAGKAQVASEAAGKAQGVSGLRSAVAGGVEKVAGAVEQVARAATAEVPALSFMDRDASRNLSAWLGIDVQGAESVGSPFRVFGLPLHFVLDPVAFVRAVKASRVAPAGGRLQRVIEDLADVERLRQAVAHGDTVGEALGDIREARGISEALSAEAQRLTELANRAPGWYDRALSFWKATRTTLNPPSFLRNFFQNFVLRFLEGAPVERVPFAVLRLLRDRDRFRRAWESTGQSREFLEEASRQSGVLRRLMELAARGYEGADRLAAVILGEATGKPARSFLMQYGEIPRTLEFLRRTGIAPFIAWQYFAIPAVLRGVVNYPGRARAVLQGLIGLQPEREKRGEFIRLGDREMRVGSVLPLNPADFGGEMPLIDVRQVPLYQLLSGLESTLSGRGRPFPMRDASTGSRVLDTGLFLKDFIVPPAFGYYVPGLVSPPGAEPGKRAPRGRLDYLFGLLGFPTRPVDALADARVKLHQLRRELRERVGE